VPVSARLIARIPLQHVQDLFVADSLLRGRALDVAARASAMDQLLGCAYRTSESAEWHIANEVACLVTFPHGAPSPNGLQCFVGRRKHSERREPCGVSKT